VIVGSVGVALVFPEDVPDVSSEGTDGDLEGVYMGRTTVAMAAACTGRRLALTPNKLIGLVSGAAQVGDDIVIIAGGGMTYVLRPEDASLDWSGDGGNRFSFLGAAYVHGMMDGEAPRAQASARLVRIMKRYECGITLYVAPGDTPPSFGQLKCLGPVILWSLPKRESSSRCFIDAKVRCKGAF
jgi:hypothetical protein